MTWEHERYHAEVARSGLWSPVYADDVLVRLAHHSSSIEGNTLTLAETLTLITEDRSPAGKQMRELYEVANHREALVLVIDAVTDRRPLDTGLVLDVHAALTDHLVWDRGRFKTSENRIAGASFEPVPPSRIHERMYQWADQTQWQTENLDDGELLDAIASSHIQFERMHPFSDGNGRTGRMIIAYQTISRFGYPAIIDPQRRAEYIEMLDTQDVRALRGELVRSMAQEAARMQPPRQGSPGSASKPVEEARPGSSAEIEFRVLGRRIDDLITAADDSELAFSVNREGEPPRRVTERGYWTLVRESYDRIAALADDEIRQGKAADAEETYTSGSPIIEQQIEAGLSAQKDRNGPSLS